jgi:hypothetical protein
MRSVLAGGVVGLVLAATAAASPRNDFTLVIKERAGPYHYLQALKRGQSYQVAIAAFGTPSSRSPDSNLCTLRWAGIGIDIHYASRLKPMCTGSRHAQRLVWNAPLGSALAHRQGPSHR